MPFSTKRGHTNRASQAHRPQERRCPSCSSPTAMTPPRCRSFSCMESPRTRAFGRTPSTNCSPSLSSAVDTSRRVLSTRPNCLFLHRRHGSGSCFSAPATVSIPVTMMLALAAWSWWAIAWADCWCACRSLIPEQIFGAPFSPPHPRRWQARLMPRRNECCRSRSFFNASPM